MKKKRNDIKLKFYKKSIFFCEIALLFFILSADDVDISTIAGVWEGEIIEQLLI